jgi:glycerophosphoryl diester phosphodiesterase
VALGPDAEASYVPPGRFVQPPATSAQPALIERVHRLDMKIHPWTVNDPAEMQELIDLGVDGIITDDPAALRALL